MHKQCSQFLPPRASSEDYLFSAHQRNPPTYQMNLHSPPTYQMNLYNPPPPKGKFMAPPTPIPTKGISTAHSSPPNLQLICNAIF